MFYISNIVTTSRRRDKNKNIKYKDFCYCFLFYFKILILNFWLFFTKMTVFCNDFHQITRSSLIIDPLRGTKFPCFHEGGGAVIRNYVFVKNKAIFFFKFFLYKKNKKSFFSKKFSLFFCLLQNLVTFWGKHKTFLDKEKHFFQKQFFPYFHEGEGQLLGNFG